SRNASCRRSASRVVAGPILRLTNQRSPRRTSSARRLIAAPLHSVGHRQQAHCHDYCPRSSSYVTAAQAVPAPPPGQRNGQYRYGERTKAAIAERQKFSALLKNAPSRPDLTALCRRAVAALTEAGALQRPMRSLWSRIAIGAALLNMAVEPTRHVLSWSGWRHLRGRLAPRFRTIQVWPKDLPPVLRQVERAVNRVSSPAG